MSEINIIEQVTIPEMPKVIDDEILHVYVPFATYDVPGIAAFSKDYFILTPDGKVMINPSKGLKGDKGDKGDRGPAGTISIGTVGTAPAGSPATVTNVGTAENAVLNFTLPQGITGRSSTIKIGTVETVEGDEIPSVTNVGNLYDAIFDFKLPKGTPGPQGPKGDGFSIYKTYSSINEMNADADNVPEGEYVLISTDQNDEDNAKIYVKKGDGTFGFLTDMSGAQGIQGPAGEPGATGPQGLAGTITVGTVTQVEEDEPLEITNSGTDEEAVLNFKIPRGKTGYLGSIRTVDGDELFFFVGTEEEYEALDDSLKTNNLFAIITDDNGEARLSAVESDILSIKAGTQLVGKASMANLAEQAKTLTKSWTSVVSGNLSNGSLVFSLPTYFVEDVVYMFRVKAIISGHTYIHTFFASIPPVGNSGVPEFVSEIHKYPTGSAADDIDCWLSFTSGYQAVTAKFKTTSTSRTDAISIDYRKFC